MPDRIVMQTATGFRHRALVAVVIVLSACSRGDKADTPAVDAEAPLMARGVDLLYRGTDPVGAEAVFRNVLQRNPSHYGAKYQLATALDRGGRPAEARPLWETVLANAEAVNDSATARTARARLAAPDTASQVAMMTLGLDLMSRQNNPAAAAEQFRNILQRNPTHYGATYQLATALDRAGQAAQARPLWVKVLGMATMNKDEATVATARSRLAGAR